jgi:hypothetical protein
MAIDTIKSSAVLDGAIATADIADDAVTGAKLANDITIAGDLTVSGNDISTAGSMLLKPAGTEIVNINNTGDVIVKGQGSNRGMLTLRAGSNTANSQLRFGDQASDTTGRIMYDHSDDTMRFQTNGSERVRISAAGLAIGGTGAANTFDDYEEGTWTPFFNTGISSPVYSIQTGRYTKIGRMVYVESDIRLTGGSVTSAHVYLGGLPFTVSSAAPYSKLDIIYQGGFHNISYPSVWLCIAGTTTAAFYRNTDGGSILGNQITSSFTNCTIRIGGWYTT